MLAIAVVLRSYSWEGLLITFLPWKLAEHLGLQSEFFLREEIN